MKALPLSPGKKLWGSITLCFLLICLSGVSSAQNLHAASRTSSCTTLPVGSSGGSAVLANVPVPGAPFKAVATNDGQWIFVSLVRNSPSATAGVAVLHRQGGQICLQSVVPMALGPAGLTLTRDNRILIAADSINVTFIDVARAEQGTQWAVLGDVPQPTPAGTIEVALSQDERYLFAANESGDNVSVMDFRRIRAHDFGTDVLIGQIPTGEAPVGLAVSPDNRFLYITSEIDPGVSTGTPCPYASGVPPQPQGSLTVASLARAARDPAQSVVAKVVAGCSPVRVVLSPLGNVAWVTARADNAVLAFSTERILAHAANAQLASVPVGTAPVGEALVDRGAVLVVANSNRFQTQPTPQTLTVLDTRQALEGKPATLATIQVGAFPRELFLEANQQTLLLTNFFSSTVSIIDVAKLPRPGQG